MLNGKIILTVDNPNIDSGKDKLEIKSIKQTVLFCFNP